MFTRLFIPVLALSALPACIELALRATEASVYYNTDSNIRVSFTSSQSPDRLATKVYLGKIDDLGDNAHQGLKSANFRGRLFTKPRPAELIRNALMSELGSRGVTFSPDQTHPQIDVLIRNFFLAPDGELRIQADVTIKLSPTHTETRNVGVILHRPVDSIADDAGAARAFEWGLAGFTRNLADSLSPVVHESAVTSDN